MHFHFTHGHLSPRRFGVIGSCVLVFNTGTEVVETWVGGQKGSLFRMNSKEKAAGVADELRAFFVRIGKVKQERTAIDDAMIGYLGKPFKKRRAK